MASPAPAAPVALPTDTVAAPTAPAASATTTKPKVTTAIVAPIQGHAVSLSEVPDPTFAGGMVGAGIAIDPPRGIIDAVAPVSGKIVQLWPHAYVVMTADKVGVLVHLGIDTVQLKGEGFTVHAAKGDQVTQGQRIVTYDVPAVEATGRNPIVPVVVMDTKADALEIIASLENDVTALDTLFSVTR